MSSRVRIALLLVSSVLLFGCDLVGSSNDLTPADFEMESSPAPTDPKEKLDDDVENLDPAAARRNVDRLADDVSDAHR
jgi:hypothetical protein